MRQNLSLEQLRVTSCSNQDQSPVRDLIKEQPVGLDMTVPMASPASSKRMRAAPGRQGPLILEKSDEHFQLIQIFALLLHPPHIPLKRGSRAEFQCHQISLRNSRNEPYRLSREMSFASFIASMVA